MYVPNHAQTAVSLLLAEEVDGYAWHKLSFSIKVKGRTARTDLVVCHVEGELDTRLEAGVEAALTVLCGDGLARVGEVALRDRVREARADRDVS